MTLSHVLSSNLFKLFLNDLPEIFKNASGSVNVNNNRVDCLMYADDIVIFSETQEGLQERMDIPYLINLYLIPALMTVSKAFLRSIKHANSFSPFLFIYLSIRVFNTKI
jgi:hypothetical protein